MHCAGVIRVRDRQGRTIRHRCRNMLLVLQLSPGMRLLGPPFHERGSGCTGRQTVVCERDFLEPV
jgi:hypothetical protein